MTSSDGTPVVRERFWVTFKAGEIRVCTSCHGVNATDHVGNPEPVNPPQALYQLLAHWKNLPMPAPTIPTPAPTAAPIGTTSPVVVPHSLSVRGLPKIKAGTKFLLTTTGSSSEKRKIRFAINNYTCPKAYMLSSKISLTGTLPKMSAAKVEAMLIVGNETKEKAKVSLKIPKNNYRAMSRTKACSLIFKSIR